MPRIFICYRREDSAGHAGRLRDALSAEFGAAEIFRDLDTIPPGEDFVDAMSDGIASCTVFLAIIGREWLTLADRNGRRRLEDPADNVRTEIAEALQRGVRVIPVLVQGASMPGAADLPDPIRPLAERNAIDLDDEGWESDVSRLVQAIRRELHTAIAPFGVSARRLVSGRTAALVLVAAAVIAGFVFSRGRPKDASSNPTSEASAARAADGGTARTAAPAGPVTPVTLPAGGEAAVSRLVYEIVDAVVSTGSDGRVLKLRVRLTNSSGYDATFFDSDFRLRIGGELHAPDSGLADVVAAESAKENTVTFPLPPDARDAVLRITNAGETVEIPLDLSGRAGLTAEDDRNVRRSGKRTLAVPLVAASARLRFGALTCELRSASLHQFSDKRRLSLEFHVRNDATTDAEFGDSHFRLVLDGNFRPPISGLSTVVRAESSRDEAIVFDLPRDTADVVLRTRFGDVTAETPLHLPPAR